MLGYIDVYSRCSVTTRLGLDTCRPIPMRLFTPQLADRNPGHFSSVRALRTSLNATKDDLRPFHTYVAAVCCCAASVKHKKRFYQHSAATRGVCANGL